MRWITLISFALAIAPIILAIKPTSLPSRGVYPATKLFRRRRGSSHLGYAFNPPSRGGDSASPSDAVINETDEEDNRDLLQDDADSNVPDDLLQGVDNSDDDEPDAPPAPAATGFLPDDDSVDLDSMKKSIKATRNSLHLTRKLVHAATGLGMAAIYQCVPRDIFVGVGTFCSVGLCAVEILRYRRGFKVRKHAPHPRPPPRAYLLFNAPSR